MLVTPKTIFASGGKVLLDGAHDELELSFTHLRMNRERKHGLRKFFGHWKCSLSKFFLSVGILHMQRYRIIYHGGNSSGSQMVFQAVALSFESDCVLVKYMSGVRCTV